MEMKWKSWRNVRLVVVCTCLAFFSPSAARAEGTNIVQALLSIPGAVLTGCGDAIQGFFDPIACAVAPTSDKDLYDAILDGRAGYFDYDLKYYTQPLDRIIMVDSASDKWTPMTIAAKTGNIHALGKLVARGADPNYMDETRNTPLGQAAWSGQVSAIKFLIAKGASVDKSAAPLLAARAGQMDALKYFVETAHVPVDTVYDGDTVASKGFLLAEAAASGKLDVCKYLVGQGCDVNFRPQSSTGSYYYSATERAAQNGQLDVVKYLVEECHAKPFDALALAKREQKCGVVAYLQKAATETESSCVQE